MIGVDRKMCEKGHHQIKVLEYDTQGGVHKKQLTCKREGCDYEKIESQPSRPKVNENNNYF